MPIARIILIALTFFLSCQMADCQPKPKRDITKDRSVVAPKKKESPKHKVSRKIPKRKSRSHQRNKVDHHFASYLYVDNSAEIIKVFGYHGGAEKFAVTTDGTDWSFYGGPKWCTIEKNSESITVKCEPNKYHEERRGVLTINSDGKAAKLTIRQLAAPLNITASFFDIAISHNVKAVWSNELRLNVKGKVKITGAKNTKCLIVASFTDIYNSPIMAAKGFGFYSNNKGEICITEQIVPNTDTEQHFSFSLSIPNGVFEHIKKKKNIKCHLSIYCPETSRFIDVADCYIYLSIKNKRRKIITSNN